MPPVRCWQVDSFTAQPFGGNPAAVCLLQEEASDGWMQAVAAEMNLAQTAFVRHRDDGFQLRWFSPTVEVDLCGHATLATAHVLWAAGIAGAGDPIRFHTHSGPLTCTRNADWIAMDFPATPAADAAPQRGLLEALDVAAPRFVGKTRFDVLVVLGSAANLRALRPDFRKLAEIPTRGVIVTAPSDDARYDFLARFFAPAIGIDEDPVTGS